MKNRIKLIGTTIQNGTDLVAAMDDIRAWTIARNLLMSEKEAALKEVDDIHSPEIKSLNEQLAARTEQIKAWAEANAEAFGKLRSIETIHGTLGWRMGQWQCDKLAGWIWQAGKKTKAGAKVVLDALKARFGKAYIRIKEEVDADGLIADRAKLTAQDLSQCGVRIFQEESFYVDPKVEDTDNRQVAS